MYNNKKYLLYILQSLTKYYIRIIWTKMIIIVGIWKNYIIFKEMFFDILNNPTLRIKIELIIKYGNHRGYLKI